MNRAAHKRLLIAACTCDRLEWATSHQGLRRGRAGVITEWIHWVMPLALPFLPRWWRVAWSLVRPWVG